MTPDERRFASIEARLSKLEALSIRYAKAAGQTDAAIEAVRDALVVKKVLNAGDLEKKTARRANGAD